MSLLTRNHGFARVWAGQAVSSFGDQVTAIALPLLAVTALDLPTWQVSALTAAAWTPYLVALPVGALTDRAPVKRHLMIGSDIARALVLATLPLAAFTVGVHFAHLLAVALLLGLAGVVSQTSYTSFFVRLVQPDDVIEANSLSSTSLSAASLAGPPLGGVLMQALGAPLAVIVDAVSYLVSAASLTGLHLDQERTPPAPRRALVHEMAEGLRALFADRLRVGILACVATINLTSYAIAGVAMVFWVRTLHLSASSIGLVQGIGAIGALAGALAAPKLLRLLGLFAVALAGVVTGAAPFLAIGAVPASAPIAWRIALVGTLLGLVTLGVMCFDIPINAVLLRITPDALRGRIVGAFTTLNYGTRPFGALLGGAVGQLAGPRVAILAAGTAGLLAVVPLALSPLRGARTLEDIPDANPAVTPAA